jgi:hypothetical protein
MGEPIDVWPPVIPLDAELRNPGLRAFLLSQLVQSSLYLRFDRRSIALGTTRYRFLPEIDCEDSESLGHQIAGLLPPAFLVGRRGGPNSSTIFGGDRRGLVWDYKLRQDEGEG